MDSSNPKFANHDPYKGIENAHAYAYTNFQIGIDPVISLVPEEEAGVPPFAGCKVAGQYELSNHLFLTTQILWLVQSQHLASKIL